jgi:hypothetical protein
VAKIPTIFRKFPALRAPGDEGGPSPSSPGERIPPLPLAERKAAEADFFRWVANIRAWERRDGLYRTDSSLIAGATGASAALIPSATLRSLMEDTRVEVERQYALTSPGPIPGLPSIGAGKLPGRAEASAAEILLPAEEIRLTR